MKKTNIHYSYILLTLTFILITTYIVCVYKTVITASEHEIQKEVFTKLQVLVSEKEHAYIAKHAQFDMDEALILGYVKTPTDQVSYIDITKDTALAVR